MRRAPVWPSPDESDSFQNEASRTARTLMERLVSDLGSNWQQLGAMDACLQKIRSHFGSEDPVLPMVREVLDGAREGMLTVAKGLEEMGFAVALDEPPDDLVDLYGEVVDSAVAEELARHDA